MADNMLLYSDSELAKAILSGALIEMIKNG